MGNVWGKDSVLTLTNKVINFLHADYKGFSIDHGFFILFAASRIF